MPLLVILLPLGFALLIAYWVDSYVKYRQERWWERGGRTKRSKGEF